MPESTSTTEHTVNTVTETSTQPLENELPITEGIPKESTLVVTDTNARVDEAHEKIDRLGVLIDKYIETQNATRTSPKSDPPAEEPPSSEPTEAPSKPITVEPEENPEEEPTTNEPHEAPEGTPGSDPNDPTDPAFRPELEPNNEGTSGKRPRTRTPKKDVTPKQKRDWRTAILGGSGGRIHQ